MAALWPGQVVPRTPSRTADWLEVAVRRFEAWKASAARSGARQALEFVKAWYPGLTLDQLATWRQQADAELAALVQERDRLVKKLADQEEGHKAALKAAQDREAALQAEFETEAAG